MTSPRDSPWPARDEELRALWGEGLSTEEIGRRMKLSKNAVVGRAHRIFLASRPSPIRRNGALQSTPRLRKAKGPTLAPLGSAIMGAAIEAGMPPLGAHRSDPGEPVFRSRLLDTSSFGTRACCWPLGDPGKPGFRFCEAPIERGRPYCAPHVAVAYTGAPAVRGAL